MTAGKCPECGNEYKNIETHKRFCKKNPDIFMIGQSTKRETQSVPDQSQSSSAEQLEDQSASVTASTQSKKELVTPDTPKPQEDTHKSLFAAVKKVWPKKRPKTEKTQKKHPILIKPPNPEFNDDGLSDADRLRKFLADAPLWTQYKPTWFRETLAGMFSKDKVFAPCVFVGENRPPRVLYLPYEPERNRLIIPEKGYYRTPTTGIPFIFHEDYMLPLINSPNLKDIFQLPGHVVESAYSSGLLEGKLQSAKEFLEEIKKYKMVCYMLGAIVILCLLAVVMVAYTYDHNYRALTEAYMNMSQRLPKPLINIP